MIDLGAYPGVVAGGRTTIAGEVYRVSAKRLQLLDRFEGCPSQYRRHAIDTPWGRAWIYLYAGRRAHGRRAVPSGDWSRRR
jgi:gamma-glutamylcyclotransferase (GGCT)/AIG2-like uncharacterized protein YtfP